MLQNCANFKEQYAALRYSYKNRLYVLLLDDENTPTFSTSLYSTIVLNIYYFEDDGENDFD